LSKNGALAAGRLVAKTNGDLAETAKEERTVKVENLPGSDRRAQNVEIAGAEIIFPSPVNVALIDDDRHFREALAFQLQTARFQVTVHASAESFLESFRPDRYDCILADICLPGMNGLQLLAEVRRRAPFVSVVFVTGSGDIAIGVQAMREGAVDCLEKPIDEQALLNAIGRATELYRTGQAQNQQRLELSQRELTLTPREHEVFGLIASGLLNKQVGATLGATERTIKTHRGRVMSKMQADSLADLVRMAETLRIQPALARTS
jgi:two-component system response regulator FixJ